ncbi:MAG: protein kinase, partial [Bryobacterales bacterium]|nr:protein kinase [Bryobacterales bacterium]
MSSDPTLPPNAADDTRPLAPGTVTSIPHLSLPGYQVLGELGRGGMGVVYHARQVHANREVALKMVLGAEYAGPPALLRFRTEGEAVARLQHPHIVAVFDVGEHAGRPFFSMELCGGGSLAGRLSNGPLTPAE